MNLVQSYDVIVIGAGHAGCEAALASARMGCETLLLTGSLDSVALFPCSASLGGPGRGHLIKEIDALGGEMAKNVDRTSIHVRRANTGKGFAVQTTWALVDKRAYQLEMKYVLEGQEKLHLRQALVTEIEKSRGRLLARDQYGRAYGGGSMVVCAGTFLGGMTLLGSTKTPAGRHGELPASVLSESLKKLGFMLGRFRTETGPRIGRKSIDCQALFEQKPDENPEPVSFWSLSCTKRQLNCFIAYTNERTHSVIRDLCGGQQSMGPCPQGKGPRYCPSIEHKVLRFKERARHPLFLQPEGVEAEEVLVNGFMTSLPEAEQERALRTVSGLENAEIVRPGYAVEYDYVLPCQLTPSLETKVVEGLFTAGQINGTSGYEEAAAQGLIAGINAALKVQDKEPLILDRSEAYIGVLIDDLVTKGVDEPYRMFTSRAEYRLLLRSDNADMRLAPYGYKLGLISEEQMERVEGKRRFIARETGRIKTETDAKKQLLAHLLRQQGMRYADVCSEKDVDAAMAREIEVEIKYEGFIKRQLDRKEKLKARQNVKIPTSLDYQEIGALSNEAREKLSSCQPANLDQAMRTPGVTSEDVSILLVYLERERKKEQKAVEGFMWNKRQIKQ